jgi:hypothetical protein
LLTARSMIKTLKVTASDLQGFEEASANVLSAREFISLSRKCQEVFLLTSAFQFWVVL